MLKSFIHLISRVALPGEGRQEYIHMTILVSLPAVALLASVRRTVPEQQIFAVEASLRFQKPKGVVVK